jgi:hypothetical protein
MGECPNKKAADPNKIRIGDYSARIQVRKIANNWVIAYKNEEVAPSLIFKKS